ncbi:hypothetical protein, partial [Enterobacter hormaechei]
FQSYQFAGIEALLGKENPKKLQQYQGDEEAQRRLAAIIQPVSLWQAIRGHLMRLNDQPNQAAQGFDDIIRQSLTRSG